MKNHKNKNKNQILCCGVDMLQYIYKFYDKNNTCLYVGKTTHLLPRFRQHKQDKNWWVEVNRIEVAECKMEFMIDLYEIYYINTLKPLYNVKDTKIKFMRCDYPELDFGQYDLQNIITKRRKKHDKTSRNTGITNQ